MNTKKHHQVERVGFEDDEFVLTVNGETHRFEVSAISPKLAKASQAEREVFQVSPSGYRIHWPLLDEDLSIDGLLGIRHAPAAQVASS